MPGVVVGFANLTKAQVTNFGTLRNVERGNNYKAKNHFLTDKNNHKNSFVKEEKKTLKKK